MKTKENHYDIQKKNFYTNVKNRADEVQKVLDHAKESTGYCDFDTWYTQEYEWRFLKDILGTNKCFGTQFDYCGLIHLPKIKWTDSEDTEHIHTLIGTHTPGYYGFLTPGNVTSANDTITVDIVEPNESCTEEDDRKISISVNTDKVQTALKNEEGYAADTYLKVVNNGTTEDPDLILKWVNLGGLVQDNLLQWDDTSKEIFKGEEGSYTIIDDIKFKGAEKTVSELIDSKSEIEVSTQKVSGAADIYSINVDGTDYNLAGSGTGGVTEEEVDTKISAAKTELEGTIEAAVTVEQERALSAEKENTDAITTINNSDVMKSGITSAGVTQITTNKNDISTINSGAVMQSGITSTLVGQITTNKNNITTINDSDVMKSGITASKVSTYDGYSTSKQDTLDSGTNIKTIASNSLLGAGDITLSNLGVYSQAEVDAKIATSTGLYLGWLQNDTEEDPDETTIGTWIINNWSSLKPSAVEQVTNNDYVFVWFSTKYLYWRVKVVTEETGKVLPSAVTWKKDLEFNDDIIGLIETVEANSAAIQKEVEGRVAAVELCEKLENKTTSLTTASTDAEYPSAKAVFTAIDEVYEDLDGKVSDEASTRETADTTLQSNIDEKVSKSGDSMTGTLAVLGGVVATASTGDTAIVNVSQSSNSYIEFQSGTVTLGYIGVNSSKKPVFYDTEDKQLATTDKYETLVFTLSTGDEKTVKVLINDEE